MLPSAVITRSCWYCGTTEHTDPAVVWEREHQVPLSLGGGEAGNVVDSCRSYNRLKSNRTAKQFRLEIECRLGEPVIFAGEASPQLPATDISSVRSFATPTGLVRLPEEVLAELREAVLAQRSDGYISTTLGSFVTDAIQERLAKLADDRLGPDQLGAQVLTLFGDAS